MRFVLTTTRNAYVSAIPLLRHAGTNRPDGIPVYTSGDSSTLRELADALGCEIVPDAVTLSQDLPSDGKQSQKDAALDLHRRCLGGTEPARDAGCVMARADGFLWAGVALAVATNRALVIFQDWEDLLSRLTDDYAHATIVCEYTALHSGVLTGLVRASLRHNIGVITGRDFAAVTFVVAKAVAYRDTSFGRSVTIVRTPDLSDETPRDRRIAIGDIDREAIQDFMSTPVDFFGVSTHGDNIDSPLGPVGILCGLTVAKRMEGPHVQTCESHGLCRRDPNAELTHLPVDRLRARFVALATCSGIGGADSIFPISLSQALAALSGWAEAFLSSIKVVRGTSVGPLFVRAALGAGLPYGEVARLFSSLHVTVTGDEPSYLLLGDASSRLVAEDRSIYTEVAWPDGAPGVEIALDATATSFLVFKVVGAPSATNEGDPLELMLSGRDGVAQHPVFATLARSDLDANLLVIVFSVGALPAIRLRLNPAKFGRLAIEQAVVKIEHNLTQLRWMHDKATGDEGVPPSQELRCQAADLAVACAKGEEALRLLSSPQVSIRRMVMCDETVTEATILTAAGAIVRQTDLALAQAVPAWKLKHSISALYDTHVKCEDRERLVGSCYICGSPIYEVDLDGCVRPDVGRIVTHCQRCGVISDRPRSAPFLFLRGPDSVHPGRRITMHVSAQQSESQVIAGALVTESLPWLHIRSDPEVLTGMIGGAESSEMSFDVDIDPLTLPGVYYIMLCSVADLGLSVTSKPLRVERQS